MYANAIPIGKPFDRGEFIEGKLKLLQDFHITITEREMEIFNTLNTPREIEKFVRDIIISRW